MKNLEKLIASCILADSYDTNVLIKGASQGDPNMLQALMEKIHSLGDSGMEGLKALLAKLGIGGQQEAGPSAPPAPPRTPDPEVSPGKAVLHGANPFQGYGRYMKSHSPEAERGFGTATGFEMERLGKGALGGGALAALLVGLLSHKGRVMAERFKAFGPGQVGGSVGRGIQNIFTRPGGIRQGLLGKIIGEGNLNQFRHASGRPIPEPKGKDILSRFGRHLAGGANDTLEEAGDAVLSPDSRLGRFAQGIRPARGATRGTLRDAFIGGGVGTVAGQVGYPALRAQQFNKEHDTDGLLGS
jgi:hypothetical protein